MPWLQEFGRRIWMLLNRRRFDRELAEEMQFHGELRADGRRFGNDLRLRERSREAWGWRWLDELGQDLRLATRTLRKTPVVTAAALLSLTLGIGANAALFSLTNALLLRPLPVPRPERLTQVVMRPGRIADQGFPNPLWEQIRDHQDVFSHAFALGDAGLTLRRGNEIKHIFANWASGDYFATLGVHPALGRFFTPADDYRGCPGVAVLGYQFWRHKFAGAPAAVGQIVQLSDQPFQVIGVAPRGFFGAEVGNEFDVTAPLCSEARVEGKNSRLDNRGNWSLTIMGRLKPGVSLKAADARLGALGPALFAAAPPPGQHEPESLGVAPGSHGFLNVPTGFPQAITTLLGLAGLVLLVACANLASLMLARGGARRRELGMRMAIGASRARLIRTVMTESLLLAAAGAAAGLLFAHWASAALVGSIPEGIALNLRLDGRVLGFTAALAIGTGLLFGGWPAWLATRVPPATALTPTRDGVGSFRRGSWIVVSQVAIALVLLAGAGLFLRSFGNLVSIRPGFDPHGVVLLRLTPGTPHPTDAALRGEYAQAFARLRGLPGISSASESQYVPTSGMVWNNMVASAAGAWRPITANAISPGFFVTLRTPLMQGREFSATDAANSTPVAIINRSLAAALFPGGVALGRQLQRGGETTTRRIVGIVADVRYNAIDSPAPPTMYLPLAQLPAAPYINFELRSPTASIAIEAVTRRALAGLDASAGLHFESMEGMIHDALAQQRLLAAMAGVAGGLGLLLTAIGLYGVVSYDVERRRAEFGVRLALGAAPDSILRLVLRETGALVALGLGLGVLAAWIAARSAQAVVGKLLYGLGTRDVTTLVGAVGVLMVIAALAAARPAARAAGTDPAVTLRDF